MVGLTKRPLRNWLRAANPASTNPEMTPSMIAPRNFGSVKSFSVCKPVAKIVGNRMLKINALIIFFFL